MIYNRIEFFNSLQKSKCKTISDAVQTNVDILELLEECKVENNGIIKLANLKSKLQSIQYSNPLLERNCEELLNKIVSSKIEQIKSDENFSFVCKLVLNYLAGLNNSKNIKAEIDKEINAKGFKSKKENMPQVFLSFAYDDILFTYALFKHFYDKEIYLYVDWMHNDVISDGSKLKSLLSDEINKSDQFLFLLSPNSEFSLKNNPYIRPWCAWEYGHFIASQKDNQNVFVFNLFSQNLDKITMLHGFNIFDNIIDRKVVGNETVIYKDTRNDGAA